MLTNYCNLSLTTILELIEEKEEMYNRSLCNPSDDKQKYYDELQELYECLDRKNKEV